ncbi:hypothetical protein EDB19DRAFT_1632515, partial [Suillus lakei]
PADKCLLLKVHITKQEDIEKAFTCTCGAFGRLDTVFNNAGYVILTEVEGTPIDKAHELFETIVWGTTNVSCAAVMFEPGKGGMVLQVSSARQICSLNIIINTLRCSQFTMYMNLVCAWRQRIEYQAIETEELDAYLRPKGNTSHGTPGIDPR